MAMIRYYSNSQEYKGFSLPFIRSANYLGMNYLGNVHTFIEEVEISKSLKSKIKRFINKTLIA